MESSMFQSVILLILGTVASSLFLEGYLAGAIALTVLGLVVCLYFSRREGRFEETLQDKPLY